MEITYICPTNCVRRPITELSSLLAEEGYGVKVAFPFSKNCPTEGWAPNKKLNETDNVKSILIPAYYLSSLRYNVPKPFGLFKKLKEIFESDIIHMWEYWYPINVIIMFYAVLTRQRKKLIMTTDGFVGYSYKPTNPRWLVPAFKLYTKSIGQILFWIPSSITTYGKAMLPYAKKAGVNLNKISVLGTGIHLDKFQKVKDKEVVALRKEFTIKSDQQVLLFLGMLSERKGISVVIEVGQRLLESGWNGKVLIVGDAHGEEDFQSLVKLEFKDEILFPGGRSDVPAFMKLADCLLLPSEGEGLPGVVMEAMASGTACVATNEGCTPDLIDSGKNGFLVEFGDIIGYGNAVRKILVDPEKYGGAAFEKINNFSWGIVSNKYLKFYQKLMKK